MEEKEIKNKEEWKRYYGDIWSKLRITRSYIAGSCVATYANRINPLFWLWVLIILIIGPFICLFTEGTIQQLLYMIYQAVTGRSIH